jgi:hypothetical protein
MKRRTYHIVSRMGNNHDLGVFNNGVATVERALIERYFLCKVGEEFLPALTTDARSWWSDKLCQFRARVLTEVKPDATVLSLPQVVQCYTGPKRRIYESAWRSLQRRALCRKDARLSPFSKFEKQCLLNAPRIINPRSPRYNLVLGKYLKKTEKTYYKAINKVWGEHTPHTVIKGMNVYQAAEVMKTKWDRFENPVAIGLDAKKFDMHVGVNALEYEHTFYNRTFDSDELATILGWQLQNFGKAYCPDGTVTFRIPGTRCSGDLNTSLGNCILMCALIWALVAELGVDAELANNGDDCVLFVDERDLDTVLRNVELFFHHYGFRMTIEEPVRTFEEVEFCQSHPIFLDGRWAMVRNVRTCLKKDPMCLVPIQSEKVWKKWLGAVGECGLATVPGCPILQSFYGAFVRSGTTCGEKFKKRIFMNTGAAERAEGLNARVVEILDESRASFYRATGITVDYQLALEKYFDEFEMSGYDLMDFQDGIAELCPPAFLRHL